MYMNDRQRVELVLVPQMMLGAFLLGVSKPVQASAEFAACKADLIEASNVGLIGLYKRKEVDKIMRRMGSLHKRALDPFLHDDAEIAKVSLIIFHFIRSLIETGYIVYDENTPMDRSMVRFIEAINWKAEEPKVNKSAIKQARKLLAFLQEAGYFKGVIFPDE